VRYSWEIPYLLAILETDERTMHSALYDAIAALEQRRLKPVSADEETALTGAEAGLQMLIGEAISRYV
jgi:hypothetical protein